MAQLLSVMRQILCRICRGKQKQAHLRSGQQLAQRVIVDGRAAERDDVDAESQRTRERLDQARLACSTAQRCCLCLNVLVLAEVTVTVRTSAIN